MRASPLIALLLAACVRDVSAPAAPAMPVMDAAYAEGNAENVLSATVSMHVRNADSVRVQLSLADETSGETFTPTVNVVDDLVTIPVLGLLAERRYIFRAVAYGRNGITSGDPIEFKTGALPADLPAYTASGVDPSPGYVVFAAGMYGLVIDNSGRVVWYHRFATGPGLSFMAEPNGHYATRPSTPDPTDVEPWVELDARGKVTRNLDCVSGLASRPHDLIVERDASYWLMCDDARTTDLTSVGGRIAARVTGTAIQHVDASGKLLFQWTPFDHFAITDAAPGDLAGATVNWTHGNSLDFDNDGNLFVSFRNLGEITKINVRSGDVMWRLGGRRSDFEFGNAAPPAFLGQHSVRVEPGGLVLLDNVGTAGESHAELYTIDVESHTARLAQSYSATPAAVTQIGGSVQPLPGGRTLVSFGTAGRVEEYDSEGRVTWRINGNAGYVFRAERIKSLYAPGVGSSR